MTDFRKWIALPDRPCGDCNVCCIDLTIDEQALQKLPGYRCKNLDNHHRCGIYETRPHTCRKFECGWRVLRWVKPSARPDRSGLLVRAYTTVAPDGSATHGIAFGFLDHSAITAEGVAETVAAAVNAGLAVHMSVPGPPGHTASIGRVDQVLVNAVVTKDKPALINLLRQLYARAKGTRRDFIPVKLKHRPGAASGSPAGGTDRQESP